MSETDYKPGAKQTLQVLSDALLKFGLEDRQNPVGPSNVQILFAIRPDEWQQKDVYFRVFRDWKPAMRSGKNGVQTDEISINKLMGVVFDVFNSAGMIKQKLIFVFDKLMEELRQKDENADFGEVISNEDGTSYWQPDLELICITPQDNPITPIVLVYYKGEQIKTLDIIKDIL